MSKPHIFFDDAMIQCSVCGTGPEEIKDGVSEHFKIGAMRNLSNPGIYGENLLWHAKCLVCKRETRSCGKPYLYY
ncbi:hypothetical protein [Acinetobacter radioresistens]|uniref:hypothetical protein n=1 Tax=Acinetobacter radioresistens TaxID=40216 RepID=UPI000553E310